MCVCSVCMRACARVRASSWSSFLFLSVSWVVKHCAMNFITVYRFSCTAPPLIGNHNDCLPPLGISTITCPHHHWWNAQLSYRGLVRYLSIVCTHRYDLVASILRLLAKLRERLNKNLGAAGHDVPACPRHSIQLCKHMMMHAAPTLAIRASMCRGGE